MFHSGANVFQAAALEDTLDYEALVAFRVNVRNVDIPEKPLVQTADEIVVGGRIVRIVWHEIFPFLHHPLNSPLAPCAPACFGVG